MQFVVPMEIEEIVIRLVHEKHGHFGVEKCYNQLQRHYRFPKMRTKLAHFIRNCLKCLYYTEPPVKNERNLYGIAKKPMPFDTIHIRPFRALTISELETQRCAGGGGCIHQIHQIIRNKCNRDERGVLRFGEVFREL